MRLPFDGLIIGTEPEEVTNPFTGEGCILTPEAVAVYDAIKGSEMLGDYDNVRAGLDWFMEKYPREYMILLD